MASTLGVSDSALGRRRAALLIYALATPLAFPHELPGGGSVDLGLGFVWLVPAALAIGIEGRSTREAARAAFIASVAGHVLLFHWFYVVTVSYGGMSWWLGALAPLVPALYVSFFTALFAIGWVRLRDRGAFSIGLGAALWVVVDWSRAHFLGGFPWATLGYGLHLDIPLLPIVRVTGIYGLSFVAVGVGLALARVLATPDRRAARDFVVVVLLVLFLHGVGQWQVGEEPPEASVGQNRIRIAAVQGDIDQGEKWDEARRNMIFEKYMGLSEAAVAEGAEWIVWPETAVPGFVEWDPGLAERLEGFARRNRVALIVGGMGVEPDATGRRVGAFFDSAFVFDDSGKLVDRYDKTQLVPFGEFVPLRGLLGHFFEALATGLSTSDVTAGEAPRVVDWPSATAAGEPVRVAVPICYELLFPHLMREFGADGADVMLAITNDAWYGRTGAPHQFLAMTSIRAAENGRWIVRAANTGISAIIDDRGRVRDSSVLFESAVLVGEVPLLLPQAPTLYARFGDVFAALCGASILWILGRQALTVRRRVGDAAAGTWVHDGE